MCAVLIILIYCNLFLTSGRAPSGKYPLTPLGKGDKMTRDKAMTGRSTPTPHPQREAGRCEALVRQEGRRP